MDKIMIAEFVGSFGDTMSEIDKNTIVASIIHWEQYKAASPPPEGNTPANELVEALNELLNCDYTSGTHLYAAQHKATIALSNYKK